MSGFFCLPRSLTRDPLWLDLPPAYQHVFLVLIDRAVFTPTKFDDHGVVIDLNPGQLCASIREILDWCGKYTSKNDVERAIVKLKLLDFVRHEVRHKKSIITISHPDVYACSFSWSETRSGTILRHKVTREQNKTKEHSLSSLSLSDSDPKEEVPSQARKPREKRVFFSSSISFSPEGSFLGILDSDLAEWRKDYPTVDVSAELLKCERKCRGNKVPIDNCRAYITTWLKNAESDTANTAKPKKPISATNKEFASTCVEQYLSKDYELRLNNDSISIVALACPYVHTIKFTENGFKDNLESEIRKRGFTKTSLKGN